MKTKMPSAEYFRNCFVFWCARSEFCLGKLIIARKHLGFGLNWYIPGKFPEKWSIVRWRVGIFVIIYTFPLKIHYRFYCAWKFHQFAHMENIRKHFSVFKLIFFQRNSSATQLEWSIEWTLYLQLVDFSAMLLRRQAHLIKTFPKLKSTYLP